MHHNCQMKLDFLYWQVMHWRTENGNISRARWLSKIVWTKIVCYVSEISQASVPSRSGDGVICGQAPAVVTSVGNNGALQLSVAVADRY
jgi:hypothetical protein